MSFSATSSLLPGPSPLHHPEAVMRITVEKGARYVSTVPSRFYTLGIMPVVSTVTGLSQALIGLIHTIIHLAALSLKQNKEHHLKEMRLGMKHIGLGLIAAVPLIGNIFMAVYCVRLSNACARGALDKVENYSDGNYCFNYP